MKHPTRIPYLARPVQLLSVLLTAILLAGCAISRSPITGKKRAYAYTWSQEVQLGAEADQQILASFGPYDDEELTRYVREVGERVLANSDLRRPDTPPEFRETPFTFRVLDSPVVNAFALPGGYVYVTRGLLAHANNEAQLAVVLGHEIGHVAARHASQRAFEQQLGQLVLVGGAIAGQELLNLPGQDILNLGSTAAQLLFLSYSRGDERESDQLGVEYAAKAGYRAAEGSRFFQSLDRISQAHGGGLPTWLSSHPDPGSREQRVLELAEAWKDASPQDRVGQNELYRAIQNMVVGEDPRQGFEEDGVFYHPELRFRFPVPRGFQVINQPTQVGMVDPDGKAVVIFSFAQQSSAAEAGRAFAGQQGIQVIESAPARSGGQTAYYVLADAQTEQGQIVRLLSYYVEHGGNVFNFLAYSLRTDFNSFQGEFQRTMQGFATLTEARYLNVQPARIEIVEAPRTAAFRTFLPSELPRGMSAEDFAIMNQVGLDETIQAGTPLKLPSR